MSAPASQPDPAEAIAIVGIAVRVPGARNTAEFWELLRDGREAVTQLTDGQLRAAGVDPELLADPRYVKAGAFLSDVEMFDAPFFGFSPRDAAIMDPQHRHFLECAWEALEDAGYAPGTFDLRVGVFAGSGMNAYLPYNLLTNPELVRSIGMFLLRHTGNDKDFLTTRVSYLLNLKGPSLNVQTACSTSLVAVHLACQSLLTGECDMALAGGVSIELPHRHGYLYQEGEILAPDGHCRSFDAKAAGTIFGSGAGIVVLRRLADAVAARDHIYAVVRGTAINNDGANKVGYLAPSVDGQAEVIADALSIAGVTADSISYVEAHGTATPVGDPIEVAALTAAFRHTTERRGFCALGSLKSNIGHLDTAAGVAGLIKTALALEHRQLPPTLHFKQPNPVIDFERSPFRVNAALTDWTSDGPLRAGVSSLGVGGTNAHVILEESPGALEEAPDEAAREAGGGAEPSIGTPSPRLVVLSARTPTALDQATRNLAMRLAHQPELDCGDVAFTCARGRKAFAVRRFVVARDTPDAVAALGDPRRQVTCSTRAEAAPVAFMFAGGGAQAPGVGSELYRWSLRYRELVDHCLRFLDEVCDVDVRSAMFPAEPAVPLAADRLERPSIGLPALFVTEYALAQLWMSWGVRPAAVIGHSLGEYAAACVAGVFTLEQALQLVVHRGRLFERLSSGSMLSVPLPAQELQALFDDELSVAAINAPDLCVASGPSLAIDRLQQQLSHRGVESKRLKISVAAHSAMLAPILDDFARRIREMDLNPSQIPIMSSVSGRRLTDGEATDPEYWVAQLRNTVRFADGIGELLRGSAQVLLEVGPGASLASIARLHPDRGNRTVLSSLPRSGDPGSELAWTLTTLGRLWTEGVEVDWAGFYDGEPRRRVGLPTYPFERQRHWIEPARMVAAPAAQPAEAVESAPARLDEHEWFARPSWQRVQPLADVHAVERGSGMAPDRRWLVFLDEGGIGAAVTTALRRQGHRVVCVTAATSFAKRGDDEYTVRAGDAGDYEQLIEALMSSHALPDAVLHLWGVSAPSERAIAAESQHRERVFHSPIYLARALGNASVERPLRMTIASSGMQRVGDERVTEPEKALLIGPVRVIPRELPHICCRSVDIAGPADANSTSLAAQLIAEAVDTGEAIEVALRADARWIRGFEPVRLDTAGAASQPRLREQGVYVITGGLGGLGLALAEQLALAVRARLVLVSRSGLPPRETWDACMSGREGDPAIRHAIGSVQALERQGADVLVCRADVTDAASVDDAFASAVSRFGPIQGVFHAAGVLNDGPLQLKSRETANAVLAPKVEGTLHLHKACESGAVDFLVLFSSVSAFLGLPGQVDYTAANAFLNAFAESRRDAGGPEVLAIDWGMWQGVGMTAGPSDSSTAAGDETNHPLLGRRLAQGGDASTCTARYAEASHWAIAEHRLAGGRALLPGTAYVEIARAIATLDAPRSAVEIRNLSFTAPLKFTAGESRDVRIVLGAGGDPEALQVCSRDCLSGDEWTEHARAAVRRIPVREDRRSLELIAARCRSKDVTIGPGDRQSRQEAFLTFGPRWKNLRRVSLGVGEALAMLELDDRFAADLDVFQVHPALLDLATSCGLLLTEGSSDREHVYVPLSYSRMEIHAPLTARIFSHARCRSGSNGGAEVTEFDVDVFDEHGRLLVMVERYAMRRLPASSLRSGSLGRPAKPGATTSRDGWLSGIRPAEGQRAIGSILARCTLSTIVVSPYDIEALMAGVEADRSRRSRGHDAASVAAGEHDPPRDEVERELVSIWQELLGHPRVGIHDDFFDLGGHSLTALRLCARLKARYGADPGIATLFETRTIAGLAKLVQRTGGPVEWHSIVPVRPQGSKTPFYCVHGVGGEVLRFTELAAHLDPARPFFAFHAPGHNGQQEPLGTIEEMAALYVKDLRAAQPHGPYLIGGYSLGARVALEMAQRLRTEGADVAFVGAIDLGPSQEQPVDYLYPIRALRNLPGWLRHDLMISTRAQNISRIRRHGRSAMRRLRAIFTGSAPTAAPDVGDVMGVEQLSEAVRRVYALSYEAGCRYRPRPYAGAVTLFRAEAQPILGRQEPDLGWGRIAQSVSVRSVPGNHLDMLSKPFVVTLARELGSALDIADSSVAAGIGDARPAHDGRQRRARKPGTLVAAAQ